MNEIRQNKATNQWVIYASARRKRPHDFRQTEKKEALPILDKNCPFCPGNEKMLPNIIMQLPNNEKDKWQIRLVPNKFPALIPDGDNHRSYRDIYLVMQGYGRHEVIIESPSHNQDMSQMSAEAINLIVETYHKRYVELMREHENIMIIIFRNHGKQAGTSLNHPHSQLIVTGIVPHYIRWREEEAQRYFDEFGRCVYCDIMAFEQENRKRVLFENKSFLAYVPFAAEVPFEIWIMPKNHKADFGYISDEEKSDLALALKDVLSRLYIKLQDPDYNYIINTSARYKANAPHLHWYFQIQPRLTTRAGFEIGSGISINPSIPEDDAKFLNDKDSNDSTS